MTKHDPTDEAETLPGIPIAGSDLEKFPSVPPIIGGGALSLDVDVQHIFTGSIGGTFAAKTTVTISAVDVSRAYVILEGSVQPPTFGGPSTDWNLVTLSLVWELTNPTTVSLWRNQTGLTQRARIAVIEYL